MRRNTWVTLLMILATSEASTAIAQSSPLDQTAVVQDVQTVHDDPCGPGGGNPGGMYWGMKPNKSKFTLVNKQGLKYRIKVKSSIDKSIENPGFYLLNTHRPPLRQDPCNENGDVSTAFFAFAIHELPEPVTGKLEPHAIIYIPMNVLHVKPPNLGDSFYVLVLAVEEDDAQCQTYPPEAQARCSKLNSLYKLIDGSAPDYEIIDEIVKAMPTILPPQQLAVDRAQRPVANKSSTAAFMHNGVIHGNL
jgi:hypothetical protein